MKANGQVILYKGKEWKLVFLDWTKRGEYMAKIVRKGAAPVWVDGNAVKKWLEARAEKAPPEETEEETETEETENGAVESEGNISDDEIALILSGLDLENAKFRGVLQKGNTLKEDRAYARGQMRAISELKKKLELL